MLDWRLREGFYPVSLWLHRDHIRKLGYDISQLTDGDMEYLAKRIADDFLGQYYQEALSKTVEYYMKHKKVTEEDTQ